MQALCDAGELVVETLRMALDAASQTGTLRMPGFLFVQGYKGDMHLEDYSFLIEHPKERILFDLGLRKVCSLFPNITST
jgi:hypothetical protein